MKAAKTNEWIPSRLGIRLDPEVFERLESHMPALKREARMNGGKMTQQVFVQQAIVEKLDRLDSKGSRK